MMMMTVMRTMLMVAVVITLDDTDDRPNYCDHIDGGSGLRSFSLLALSVQTASLRVRPPSMYHRAEVAIFALVL